jgi:nucleoside-diphosphate kinase
MEFESIEKTFVMIKPDGIKRGLVGKIFSRLEEVGLKLTACRMIMPSEEQAKKHYPGDDEAWLTKLGGKSLKNFEGQEEVLKETFGTLDALEIGKKTFEGFVKMFRSGPAVLMVWEGNHAISVVRKIVGYAVPDLAAPGTIRGDWAFDTPRLAVKSGRIVFTNLIHASETPEEVEAEIKNWFGDSYKDLGNYEKVDYVGAFEAFE